MPRFCRPVFAAALQVFCMVLTSTMWAQNAAGPQPVPAPSAVPLNPIPQPADTKLATALQISGHVIFQENDAILDQLLGQRTDSEYDLRPTT